MRRNFTLRRPRSLSRLLSELDAARLIIIKVVGCRAVHATYTLQSTFVNRTTYLLCGELEGRARDAAPCRDVRMCVSFPLSFALTCLSLHLAVVVAFSFPPTRMLPFFYILTSSHNKIHVVAIFCGALMLTIIVIVLLYQLNLEQPQKTATLILILR